MKNRRQGSALILALWTLFFLAALTVAVGTQVSAVLSLAGQLRAGLTARALAAAGAETAIADLVAGDPDITNNPARFHEASVLEGGTFTVCYITVQDGLAVTNYGLGPESRKLDVNRAGTLELSALLCERGGLGRETASAVADSIVDWRDADSMPLTGGAEVPYYTSLTVPYSCHNGDVTVVEELLLVKGMTPELFARIRPYITVRAAERFGGTALGHAVAGGRTTGVARVEFVVDRSGRKRLWHEE